VGNKKNPKLSAKKTIIYFLLAVFIFSAIAIPVFSANQYSPGEPFTIGEFVYDDNYVATTSDCYINIWDPSGSLVIDNVLMATSTNGWHYYDFAGSSTMGIWPATMSCGTASVDLIASEKTFIIATSTESYIDTATSTIIGEIQKNWTVYLSDFGETTTGEAYQVKLWVLNYAAEPTDAVSLPTLTITDAAGTKQRTNVEMTKVSNGVYYYSYTIPVDAVGGVWETEASTTVEVGKTIMTNDYWWVSASPADVEIISIAEHTGTSITADVEITNKGTSGSDFYYVYCIVDSEDNLCGGNDDIDNGSDTKYIAAGQTLPLSLGLDVLNLGTYWFKVKARALSEVNWAAASEQFIASEAPAPSCGNGSCSGGETCSTCPADCGECGGGGGGGGGGAPIPTCRGADFNYDAKVNSIDFSIMLYFWKTRPPFANACVDINKDQKVDSVDFSILLYQWGSAGIPVSFINEEEIYG